MKIVLAVVGLVGSGKTEATDFVSNRTAWPKIYLGQVTFDEIKKRGLPINEVNERMVREDIRNQYGMSAYAILNIPSIRLQFAKSSVLVESLYSWEEYLELRNAFGADFKVLAIHANPEIRAKRMKERHVRSLSQEEFESRDFSQIANLNQAGPIARADYVVINEGSLDELHKQLDDFIKKLPV